MFVQLSVRDLLEARDQYHIHLMQHPNVVATAVGRYRIRQRDSWPTERGFGGTHGKYARTLENSEVRYYSWPAILIFLENWEDPSKLSPGDLLPKTLYLPDGRRVPVCVVEAPKEDKNEVKALNAEHPVSVEQHRRWISGDR
jgi:hypothetical protein